MQKLRGYGEQVMASHDRRKVTCQQCGYQQEIGVKDPLWICERCGHSQREPSGHDAGIPKSATAQTRQPGYTVQTSTDVVHTLTPETGELTSSSKRPGNAR